MSSFCPVCESMLALKVNEDPSGPPNMMLMCRTCAYRTAVKQTFSHEQKLGVRKAVDDVMGGEESWQNVDQTEAVCPKCNHNRAYFTQHQLRSADEPMTIFYKCVKCANRWREG